MPINLPKRLIQVKQFAGGKIDSRNGNFYLKIMFFQIFKISSTKTIAGPHRSWQPLLGPKKSASQSIYIGPMVHIVATWDTIKQKILTTPLGDNSWPGLPKLADILA